MKEITMSIVSFSTEATPQPRKRVGIILAGFVVLFILLDRIPWLLADYDLTTTFLLTCGVVVTTAITLEILLFKHTLPQAWRGLGFGRLDRRTLIVTTLVSGLMVAFYPIFAWITGAPLALHDNWLWLLVGIFAQHGIGEEVVFRGFTFRNLRAGRTFGRAAFLSLLIFAVAHVYLFTYTPWQWAFFGTILALAIAYPMAYLFERGNNTIWSPAILHTVVHSIALFILPEALAMTAAIAWMLMWTVSMLLVYVFRKRLFETGSKTNNENANDLLNPSQGLS
jgi:membrane protease YdiL (CAAX protease family)